MVEAKSQEELKKKHKEWIEEKLVNGNHFREEKWTESDALGREEFVKSIKEELGVKVLGRTTIVNGDQLQLREAQRPY